MWKNVDNFKIFKDFAETLLLKLYLYSHNLGNVAQAAVKSTWKHVYSN